MTVSLRQMGFDIFLARKNIEQITLFHKKNSQAVTGPWVGLECTVFDICKYSRRPDNDFFAFSKLLCAKLQAELTVSDAKLFTFGAYQHFSNELNTQCSEMSVINSQSK